MNKLLIVIIILFLISFSNRKIIYQVYELFEEPDKKLKNSIVYNYRIDSLKHIDSNMNNLLKINMDALTIYNLLKRENRLLGIAVYTYQRNNKIHFESLMIVYKSKSKSKSLWYLSIFYNEPTTFEYKLNYSKMSKKSKIDYILNLSQTNKDYSFIIDETEILGFPQPIPDATDE